MALDAIRHLRSTIPQISNDDISSAIRREIGGIVKTNTEEIPLPLSSRANSTGLCCASLGAPEEASRVFRPASAIQNDEVDSSEHRIKLLEERISNVETVINEFPDLKQKISSLNEKGIQLTTQTKQKISCLSNNYKSLEDKIKQIQTVQPQLISEETKQFPTKRA